MNYWILGSNTKKKFAAYILSKEFTKWIVRKKRNDWHCFIQHAWWVHIILRRKTRWIIGISRFHYKENTHNPQGDNTMKTHTTDKETNNVRDNNYCNKVYTLIKEFTQIRRSKRRWLEFLTSNSNKTYTIHTPSKKFTTWIVRKIKRNNWHCFIQHAWWVHINSKK